MVISQAQAAEELGLSPNTITDLVRVFGLETRPIRTNGRARGLDAKAIATIRRRLGLSKAAGRSSAPEPLA